VTSGDRDGRAASDSTLGDPEPGATMRRSETTRIEAFSDGVMAIAITVLVLDVHLPSHGGTMLARLEHLWPAYLAYADSFLTIAVIWLCHHAFFSRVRRADAIVQWANLALLMMVAFIPFATSVLSAGLETGGRDAKVATALYGIVASVQTVPWLMLWTAVRRRPQLLEPGYDAKYAQIEARFGWAGLVAFGLCAGVALISPMVALCFYVLVVVGYGLVSDGIHQFRKVLPARRGRPQRAA
jgi:uncharacterized membrane protein